jgi:hypothetical protein
MSNMEGLERGYLELIKIAKGLNGASWSQVAMLKARVAKTLMLSWNARGKRKQALTAAIRSIAA